MSVNVGQCRSMGFQNVVPLHCRRKSPVSGPSAPFGKFYGHVVSTKTMTYAELCKHMAEHNSVYGEDVCLGVANKLQSCLLEQLLEGKKVQFGDLGTFYLSVKGTGVDNEEDYNIGGRTTTSASASTASSCVSLRTVRT